MNHLQTELVKTKQELGEALNSAYEYEKQNNQLFGQVKVENRDSISSNPNAKKSKMSKLKSFLKVSK